MIQFWQGSQDEALTELRFYYILRICAPILSITLLLYNFVKEIVQLKTEGKEYFNDFENSGDIAACILVSIC